VYAGGGFASIGRMPQSYIACTAPAGVLAAPAPSARVDLALRLSPNPATSIVRLDYALPEAAAVDISMFDVQGRRIAQPVRRTETAGEHSANWDPAAAGHARPGVYFVRLEAGPRSLIQRLVLIH
jgi:hypothetical protein